jgi:hypothetical protein
VSLVSHGLEQAELSSLNSLDQKIATRKELSRAQALLGVEGYRTVP